MHRGGRLSAPVEPANPPGRQPPEHTSIQATAEPPRMVALVIAILSGLFIAIVGSMTIGVIFLLNLEIFPTVPWAVVPAVAFLVWLMRYLSGRRHAEPEAGERRRNLRARALTRRSWLWALAAIAPALVGLHALRGMLSNAASQAVSAALEAGASLLPRLPLGALADQDLTLWSLFIVNYLIAAPLLEEAAFRGYMQVPAERLIGPWLALPLVATIFALLHWDRGYFALHWVLALFLCTLAWRADSILPTILAHAGVNLSVLLSQPALVPLDPSLPAAAPVSAWSAALTSPWLVAACALLTTVALVGLGRSVTQQPVAQPPVAP